jgi:hypothetical protein
VPNAIYLGLLAGAGHIGLLPGQTFEVVAIPHLSFGAGTSLTVQKDGSFSFTVPKRYSGTVSFLFKLRIRDTSDEVTKFIPTNLTFLATIIVTPPRGGRGSAGNFLGLSGFLAQQLVPTPPASMPPPPPPPTGQEP